MTRSETIDELAKAMALAQREIHGAAKSSENPHFRSKYADLAAVWEACREPLAKNGLAVIQFPRLVHMGDDLWAVELETLLTHSSGQFMSDTLAMPITKVDAHGMGSAITYTRRYALSALAGVAPEDDDAEGATNRSAPTPRGEPFMATLARAAAAGKSASTDDSPLTVRGKVLGLMQRPAGTGTRHIVTLSDQRTYGTLAKPIADAAEDAQAAGAEVELTFRVTRLGNELLSVRDLSEDEPPI